MFGYFPIKASVVFVVFFSVLAPSNLALAMKKPDGAAPNKLESGLQDVDLQEEESPPGSSGKGEVQEKPLAKSVGEIEESKKANEGAWVLERRVLDEPNPMDFAFFTKDSKNALIGGSQGAKLWDLSGTSIQDFKANFAAMDMSRDGTFIFSISPPVYNGKRVERRSSIAFRSADTIDPEEAFSKSDFLHFTAVVISPDGKTGYAGTTEGNVFSWKNPYLEEKQGGKFSHNGDLHEVFSTGSKILSLTLHGNKIGCGTELGLDVWDLEKKEFTGRYSYDEDVTKVVFLNSENVILLRTGKKIKVVKMGDGSPQLLAGFALELDSSGHSAFSVSANRKIAISGRNTDFVAWDLQTGKEIAQFSRYNSYNSYVTYYGVQSVELSPDLKKLVVLSKPTPPVPGFFPSAYVPAFLPSLIGSRSEILMLPEALTKLLRAAEAVPSLGAVSVSAEVD